MSPSLETLVDNTCYLVKIMRKYNVRIALLTLTVVGDNLHNSLSI